MAIKNKTKAEKNHLSKVADFGCIACRKIGFEDTPAEIHHIRDGVGMAQRATHFEVIPLCTGHHRRDDNSIHRSKLRFESEFGTERELLAELLHEIGYKTVIGK
jgi:hypothetical protein